MPKLTQQTLRLSCFSEYDTLQHVVLCEPRYMKIRQAINETQKHYIKENIDIARASKQHQTLVQTLEELGIKVTLLPPHEEFPEQVFTRDIGFTIGETIFIAEMGKNIRQGEELILKDWLQQRNLPFIDLKHERIEGGDVLVDGNKVLVGISERTTEKAAAKIQKLLPDFQVISVPIEKKYLHLDCVFNPISPNEALVYKSAISKKEAEILASHYNLIEVSESEQFTLGTNVLSIGGKRVISLPVNKAVNKQLKARGYTVIEVDITEIIKSGGSFRCVTLPLLRSNS